MRAEIDRAVLEAGNPRELTTASRWLNNAI